MAKLFYLYDAVGVFVGSYTAQENPRVPDTFITPKDSTDVAPPDASEGQVAVYAAGTKKWSISTDYRGVVLYNQADGSTIVGTTVGELPDGYALTPPAPTLSQMQATQCDVIDTAYTSAIQQPISFTSAGGVEQTFQADDGSQDLLVKATQGYGVAGSTPSGFYWVATDNTQVPFTLPDLQGLYAAILSRGWSAFQQRQDLKKTINAATTIAAVQAVTWPSI